MADRPLPRASAAETAAVLAEVGMPLFARGLLVRRPRTTDLLDRLEADRRGVERLRRLRARHGPGPVVLGLPGREVALPLVPEHVERILAESPEPFATASAAKRAALAHFQPHGVLASRGPIRERRRELNERALQTGRPVHELGPSLAAKVDAEIVPLLEEAGMRGELDWEAFAPRWWRLIRRVVLGDSAAGDRELTDMLGRLRRDANWAFLRPRRDRLGDRFRERLDGQLRRAEPGSLAGELAAAPAPPGSDPGGQVPQWLFAFEAAGLATLRALAVLASGPELADRARAEVAASDAEAVPRLPFLRNCVLESVRLWPTTPAILRESTASTEWDAGRLGSGASVLIYAPLFHREPGADLDRLRPELWEGRKAARRWALVPFSAGPGECPGRNLVLLTASLALARLTERLPASVSPALDPARLPATLSPFRLRLGYRGAVRAG